MSINSKTFNGKQFEIEYRTKSKHTANDLAKRLRHSGRSVRITKHTFTEYRVYKR